MHILDFTKKGLEDLIVTKYKEKKFRVKQIIDWLYKKKTDNFDKFKNLSKKFIEKLKTDFEIYTFKLASKQTSKLDATTRYNFKTKDGYLIPTVFIPKIERNVVCVSTQIGCAIGCKFCNSGKVNFVRNLTCGEIIEQILRVEDGKINGVLYMGMGEPLLNYDNTVKSIKILTDENMFGLGKRRITVSTVGIVPNIYKLAEENLKVKLAISLHTSDDKTRKELIPNLKYSIDEILKAAVYYAKKTDTVVTIEYVLIKNKNDSIANLQELIEILLNNSDNRKIYKINLIPYNPVEAGDYKTPEDNKIEILKNFLVSKGFLTFVRKPYGLDINAACGQLGF
jgi:23S rRNA (adenine2503-C2)-methyltransferase